MSGWEKYAVQAAEALDPDPFDAANPHHASPAYQIRRELARDRVGRVLAAVGPLIAEDARERMVAAAGKALEREGTATPIAVHQRFPDDGVDYCGWHVGSGVVRDGCGEVWPCSTVRRLQAAP